MRKYCQALILFMIAFQCYSQGSGRIFIRNFLPTEYKAAIQNWNVIQDNAGVLYFSNVDGLMEYDGVSWRVNKVPGLHEIHMGHDGKIYAALENDFGVYSPGTAGNFEYKSLKDLIPGGSRDISTVWQINSSGEQIIFLTRQEIFILDNERIKVIKAETYFPTLFSARGKVYIQQFGKGLYTVTGDTLELTSDEDLFRNERITHALPFGDKDLLTITRNEGIYFYSPEAEIKVHKLPEFTAVDRFLTENPGYCGIILPGGDIAVGTVTNGIIIFSREGRIIKKINKNSGLLDNAVYGLYTDREGNLWAALDNGISLIQYNLPFSFYNEQNGLNGNIMSLYYYQNHLYAGTSQYLFVQNEQGNFEIVRGSGGQNFDLIESHGILLSAQNPGILAVKGKAAVTIKGTEEMSFIDLIPVPGDPDHLIAGAAGGLYLLEYKNSSWHLARKIGGFDMPVYFAVPDKNGTIWASSLTEFYKVQVNTNFDSVTIYRNYTTADGLPGNTVYPSKLPSGEIVFCTDKGVYKYLQDSDNFAPLPDLAMLKGGIWPFIPMDNGEIWFEELLENSGHEKGILKLSDGKYSVHKTSFYKFNDISSAAVCSTPDGAIYFGTFTGLLRYDPHINIDTRHDFNTLIRKVSSRDSLLFGGTVPDTSESFRIKGPDIHYNLNNLVFNFASTSYEDSEKNLYSFRLSGQDSVWSDWTRDSKKEYTNLREGKYIFEVKSRNQYQEDGTLASYSFRILPPLYRSWWAFTIYGLLSVFLVWLIVKLNVRRLEKQKEQLEKTVTERTAQLKATLDVVNTQKLEIETAHGLIKDSINYAKYIQSAILPGREFLDMYLKDYFVLFRPKDVVSGDFYWATFVENLTIIAAVDCTGHGVPGAFMSMLGAALLNEIVNKEYITHPGVILRRLRKEVIRSLHQRGETGELKDGMDISLCTIDFTNMKLQFAGANNPLYLIRGRDEKRIEAFGSTESGESVLYEIKGDRMPISIHESMKDFTTHEIDLARGDTLYLFSDGYADQFGGPAGKKLHYGAFRRLLLAHAHETAEEQKQSLDSYFLQWKGAFNQVDDVIVIGIRV